MGDSAGGNLSAVVANRLQKRSDLPKLKVKQLNTAKWGDFGHG